MTQNMWLSILFQIIRNINYSSKKTISCIFAVIFFCAFGAHAAVLSPEPDNAALLYYQAFLLLPELDSELINPVLRGADPNEKVREYLEDSRETIRIAEAATEILDCSWGIMRSQGVYNLTLKTVLGQLRQLAFLLEVDARILAADGDYRAALDRCLSIRRLAQHIADEAVLGYLVSLSLHGRAFLCIQHVLGSMSPDTDRLTWLQGQLRGVQGAPPLPGRAMEIALDDTLKFLRMHPELLATWRENVSGLIEDDSAGQEILNLTDEELLAQARESYNSFLASVNRVIASDILYQQKYAELQELTAKLADQNADGDPVGILSIFGPDVVEMHDIYVRQMAHFNAVSAAIEIYLVKAETSQLPETLPSCLPNDPFSSDAFEYEITNEGFVLRSRHEEICANKLWEFEFKVNESN